MNRIGHKLLSIVMGIMLIVSMFFVGKEAAGYVNGSNVKNMERCVVIDAGHGGDDPGKIGINNALEKEINLQIAFRVKEYLEQNDIRVIMTRETDDGLYDRTVSNKKVQDMKRRLEIIDKAAPEVTVSIHQNSYPEESIHGAQVFYYNGSAEGQKLAQKIQEQFVKKVDADNKRQIKANDSYYLLKKTATPIVIVECGFLSNYQEAENLCKEEYQEKVAWAISMGVIQCLNNK